MSVELDTEEKKRLVELLEVLATNEGLTPSNIAEVRFFRANNPIPRAPVVYDPSIIIVGQGRKRGYFGEQIITYDSDNFLVLSVPLPFECATEASPEEPF